MRARWEGEQPRGHGIGRCRPSSQGRHPYDAPIDVNHLRRHWQQVALWTGPAPWGFRRVRHPTSQRLDADVESSAASDNVTSSPGGIGHPVVVGVTGADQSPTAFANGHKAAGDNVTPDCTAGGRLFAESVH